MYKLIDYVTKDEVNTNNLVFTGNDHPWEVLLDFKSIAATFNKDYFISATPRLLKYLPLMPIQNPAAFVSLNEFATPLIRSRNLEKKLNLKLYFKVEGKNPTGSFKDRGSALEISLAKEFGAKAIILASTGNMAASCACYAAIAKIPCYVVVPENVSLSKMAQVISFGGNIIQVKDDYNDAAKLAYEVATQQGFYLAGDYAFRVEGQKTAAFELLDQLSLQVPDSIVIPMGCGTNIAAYAKGFSEYQQLGFINKSAKLIGVQAKGAAAIVQSFQNPDESKVKLNSCNTIASAIAVASPVDSLKALAAIKNTGGEAFAVSDEEILAAQYVLAKEEGLFVETAAAATIAYLLKQAEIKPFEGETIVCILSGEGLKDPQAILNFAMKPELIDPSVAEFQKLYEKTHEKITE